MNYFFPQQALQRRIVRDVCAALAAFVVLSLSIVGTARAAGYTLTPTEANVRPGQIIVFEGSGFIPGERVTTWATSPNQAAVSGDFASAKGDDGALRVSFSVPRNALNGQWSFTAYGETSRTPVITTFQVVGGSDEAPQVQAWAAPPSGAAGTVFAFAATGFEEGHQVSYWFTAPDGSIFAAYPQGGKVDENGRVDIIWASPTSAPRGTWVVTIQNLGKTQVARAVRFEIT